MYINYRFLVQSHEIIATAMLNVMISFGIAIQNLNGGTECSAHCSQYSDIYSSVSFAFWLTRPENALFIRFSSLADDWYIN